MIAVGVRELKAQLSRYLREVQGGETVLVTDRGRVIAELRLPGAGPAPSADDQALQRLAARIPLVIGEPHDPDTYRVSPLRSPAGTAQRLINEERGDR